MKVGRHHRLKNLCEVKKENERLHKFALQLSERLFLVAEILAIKAEHKDKRKL